MTGTADRRKRRRHRRVDDLPPWLAPLVGIYGVTLGVLLYAVVAIVRLTCRFRVETAPERARFAAGERIRHAAGAAQRLDESAAPRPSDAPTSPRSSPGSSPRSSPSTTGAFAPPSGRIPQDPPQPPPEIQCIWHEALVVHIAAHLLEGRAFVWMQHPLVYMKPVHVLLRLTGVRTLVYGSTGHGGQVALDRVLRAVGRGRSTLLAVDGPAGPAHEPKRGAFELAAAAGLPLTAIRYAAPRAARLPGWDRKLLPRPFSEVRVARAAIPVGGPDDERARAALSAHLG